MSPILDLQQRLQEVGRIRMGTTQQFKRKDGSTGTRPAKLAHWRLTSRDQQRLEVVAQVYGGTVQPWAKRDGEYEVFTEADSLRVLIIPGQALSQWWEMWSGGGCVRRCDGQHEVLTDGPCLCPAEYDDRAEAAGDGKACKPTTRLAVLLPDVPGIGHYRLETHSYYAAVELAAAAGLLEEATRRGALLPARLRIDLRHKLAGGKTTHYPVPVIDVDITADQLIQLGAGAVQGEVLQLEAGPVYQPVQADPAGPTQPDVAAGLDAIAGPPAPPAPRANAAAPVGTSAPPPNPAPLTVDLDDDAPPPAATPAKQAPSATESPAVDTKAPPAGADTKAPQGATASLSGVMANGRQRRMLWATVRGRPMSEEQFRSILRDVTGQESTASIPAELFDAVLANVQGAALVEGGTPA